MTAADAVVINANVTRQTGEPHLLRDAGLLESACAVPQNSWAYGEGPDGLSLAVKLLLAIARNHPFVQGNKRTAFIAALTFVQLNGWTVDEAQDTEAFADHLIAALQGELSEEALGAALARLAHPPEA